MVHFEDAEVALAAVMCANRLPCLLTRAFLAVLCLKKLTLKRRRESLCYPARVRASGPQKADVRECAKAIEGEEVEHAAACEGYTRDKLVVDDLLEVPVEDVRPIANILPERHEQKSLNSKQDDDEYH